MCGIAGFIDFNHALDERARARALDEMCRCIAHRGPDDQGTRVEGAVALGMRRLSIIDLATGHQPMQNETGDVTIVFNGEIYNYRTLRRELQSRGHHFQTDSDTETIVHAYEEYGAGVVKHLRGMFAFAVWDARERKLFLARDRVGKKPLYYTTTRDGSFVFGSELKSLLKHPNIEREIDLRALDAYLSFGYVPDPLSIFKNISKLPPGHTLEWKNGNIRLEQYWDFPFGETKDDERSASVENYMEELRRLLDEAVRVRLVSDVPLGAFLSGGIDSSVVVGLMSRHTAQPVKTFSIGFHEDSFDELKYARITAKHFKTDHHEFIVTPEICRVVEQLVHHFDEPFADPSAIPTFMVSKLAREHVTVALSGDGGDELFAGYTRYVVDRKRERWARVPRTLRAGLLAPLSRRLPHGARGRNFLHNVAQDSVDRYLESVSMFTPLAKRELYAADFRRALVENEAEEYGFDDFRKLAARIDDPLEALLYLDSKTYLPGDIMTKVDRASMAASLEARAPLLDHQLIEFVTGIPSRLKLRGEETKFILKEAVRDLVPAEILNRPKQGFGLPIQHWINRELRDEIRGVLTERRTRERGYFDPRHVEVLLDEHARERRDCSIQLWTLFICELWHRAYYDDGQVTNNRAAGETETACVPVGAQ